MSASELPHVSELIKKYNLAHGLEVMALTCCGIVFCFKAGYVCIPDCLSYGVLDSEFGGDPRHSALREYGFQYGGQLGKHIYPLAKGLVAFGLV